MNNSHEHLKNATDIAATGGGALVAVSHWAEVVTPIVALLVGLLTLTWWIIRLFDRWRLGATMKGATDE